MKNVLFVSFYHSYFDSYEIVYHCGFDLHFLSDKRCETFYVLSHSYMLWGQKPIEIIHPFLITVFVFFFFFLSYKSPLYFPGTAAAAVKSFQSCLTLCNPIDGSPPGSPVPGILQARTLEWVAISLFNA